MIAARVNLGAMQRLPSGHVHPIFHLRDLRAHAAEILGHQRDAVGFLDAQFLASRMRIPFRV